MSNQFNAYSARPQGRLSAKKVREFADVLNAELQKQGAKRFIEIGQRYNYYAVDELGVEHFAWRQGDNTGRSGIARTFAAGLTAAQCVDSAQEFYYQAMNEVSV